MIKSAEQRRAEAEQEAQEFADYITQQEEEPRKRKPPTIEESRSTLETQPFNIDLNVEESAEGSDGGGGGGGPPEEPIGACCYEDGDCEEIGEMLCSDNGGDYQGDDSECGEVECPIHEGACCPTVGDCFITGPSICEGTGGTCQGDDTTCDPDPCMLECACGFDAFDESGRRFLKLTRVLTANFSDTFPPPSQETCSYDFTFTFIATVDPDTCEITTECSGSYTFDRTDPDGTPHHTEGDPCDGFSVGCGICDDCGPLPGPTYPPYSCSGTGVTCTTTELDYECSTSDDCGGGVPSNGTLSDITTLSDECTPI